MRLVKWLIAVIVLVGIFVSLTPVLCKWYALRWLESQGYDGEIKKLSIDFVFSEINLNGVHIKSPSGERAEVFEARIDFDLWALTQGRLVFDEVQLDSLHLDLDSDEGDWTVAGLTTKDWIAKMEESELTLEVGRLQADNSDLCRTKGERCLLVESFMLARAKWVPGRRGATFEHRSPMYVSKAFLRDQSRDASIFYLGNLKIEEGFYGPDRVELKQLEIANLQLVENKGSGVRQLETPYQTQLGELRVSSVHMQKGEPYQVRLGDVEAISLRQALYKDSDAVFVLPDRLRTWFPELTRFAEQGANIRDWPIELAVEEVTVRDGVIAWLDHSVTPPAMETVSAIRLQLSRLDSEQAESPTAIEVAAKVGQTGSLRLEGNIYPFSSESRFDLKGGAQNVDLANVSAYTDSLFNQRVEQGMISVAFESHVENQQLTADTRWRLAGFKVDPVVGGGGRDMPLQTSLDLLEDHNESVDVHLPISGTINGDQLSLNYVFGTLMRRTLSDMAREQPGIGASFDLAPRAGSPSAVTLRSLLYPVNQRELASPELERFQELASSLRKKSHLSMAFCPVSTGGEWAQLFNEGNEPQANARLLPAHKQALLDLASARGRALRMMLKEAGVSVEQFKICDPNIDMTKAGRSFVAISM